jgi:glycosyltransferase involved in cell wall biosynthesis
VDDGLDWGGDGRCTVIIATLASADRAAGLRRAIDSVLRDNSSLPEVFVVANGTRYDPALLRELMDRTDIRTAHLAEGSLPGAIAHGVAASSTSYFGFLDDDDEYLPGAVDRRLRALQERPAAAVLASNGYRASDGEDRIALKRLAEVEADPLLALFQENWLPSCGGLFRRSLLPDGLFQGIPALLEWTWVAFHLARAGGSVAVLDEPTFRIHATAGSESRSPAYVRSLPDTLHRIREESRRADVRAIVTRHLTQSLYTASAHSLRRGAYRDAWGYHLRCLRLPTGWRFWRHTARLLGLRRTTRD